MSQPPSHDAQTTHTPFEPLPAPPAHAKPTLLVGAVAFCVLGLGALSAVGAAIVEARQHPSPRVVPADQVHASLALGAVTRRGDYTPSSKYVEPGADSDVTTLDMTSKEDAPSDPELVDEGLSEDAIQRVIAQRQADLIQCYADSLEDEPDLEGRVDFHFRIAPDGHVAMVQVTRSALRHKPTEDCFVERSRRWAFPRSSKKALVKFDTNLYFAAH